MIAKDADIIVVPGWGGSGPEHWQTRWQAKLSTARRVQQPDWDDPNRESWTGRLAQMIDESMRPVVLMCHSLGVPTAIQALPQLTRPISGAFFVAPPDVDANLKPEVLTTFGPYPTAPLTFPSVVVASSNDEYCSLERAEALAFAWGSLFIDAGEAGHINTASGHGPWPEGLLVFSQFLSKLKA